MPWIDEPPAPQPIVPTGVEAPNPFRAWHHDLADAVPWLAGFFLAIIALIALRAVWGRLAVLAAKLNRHLRTPVQ